MKKFLSILFATVLLAACGDDNSVSSFEKQGEESSVQESDQSGWTTVEKTDRFSFFDEEHLRYYFLEEECDYDSATNSFKWVTEDYKNIFDRYDISPITFQSEYGGDSLKYMVDHSFGFKMSNDTLYECD